MRLMEAEEAPECLGACLRSRWASASAAVQAVYCLLLKALEVFGVLLCRCHRWIRNCCYGRFSRGRCAAQEAQPI